MKTKQILLAAVFAVMALTLAPAASAQALEEGTWTGQMIPPGSADGIDISYEVAMDGDVLTITLVPPEGAGADADGYEFSDIQMEDGDLVFWWQPGPRVDCVLESQEDGSYEGECSDPDGDTGILTMVQPGHDADIGHDEDEGHDEGHDKDEGHDED